MENFTRILGRAALLAALSLFPFAGMRAADGDTPAETVNFTAALPVLRLTMQDDVQRYMPYSNGTLQLTDTDGSVVSLKAKLKTRGATAQQYLMKPSLTMKLRSDDYSASVDSSLLGIRTTSKYILDAMAVDAIAMRNRVGMDIWNDFSPLPYDTEYNGRNGTEGRFVEVYLNGEYLGIYCLSDQINRRLLNLKKYDDEKQLVRGVLYKSGTEDIENQNDVGHTDDWLAYTIGWHNAWELKEPDEEYACEEAWQPLIDVHKLADEYKWDKDGYYAQVKKYFYIDNLVDYQLFHMALCIVDNWGNKNHFFSVRNIQKNIDDADPTEAARRKFVLTPWDLDTDLGGAYDGTMYGGNYNEWLPEDMVKNGGFFPFPACQAQSEYKELMRKRWDEVRRTVFRPELINKRLETYRDLFLGSGAWARMTAAFEGMSVGPKHVDDLAKEISFIEEWYAKQYAAMDAYFGTTDGISAPRVSTAAGRKGIYSVQGVRLSAAPEKGVYIEDGVKRVK